MMPDECKPAEHEILLGHECTAINATNHFVNVTTSVIREGKLVEKIFQCNFLVGTDGAGSTVRKLMGLGMNGEKDLQNLVSIHFRSQDLGQFFINERPGMLFFVLNTEAIGVIVARDLLQGEFVLQMCEKLIYKLAGRELADVRVLDVKPWVMHAEVAEKFLACNNHVILAGDAAHQFPPAGGFGMNTGIQDAHNLAWKLASVQRESHHHHFFPLMKRNVGRYDSCGLDYAGVSLPVGVTQEVVLVVVILRDVDMRFRP